MSSFRRCYMSPKRSFCAWLAFWLVFYTGVLPLALPLCLDWLSRPSNWGLGWGLIGAGCRRCSFAIPGGPAAAAPQLSLTLLDGFLKTAVYEAYRVATNRYTADSLISNRGSYEAQVKTNLISQLQAMGFTVQTGLQTENRIRQAEAQARINIAEAEGRAKAIRLAADAQAYANEKQQQSLMLLLVQMRWD